MLREQIWLGPQVASLPLGTQAMLVLKQRALTGQQPQSQMKQLAASNKLLPKTGEPTDATPDPLTSNE
jgi:hypothetical protein